MIRSDRLLLPADLSEQEQRRLNPLCRPASCARPSRDFQASKRIKSCSRHSSRSSGALRFRPDPRAHVGIHTGRPHLSEEGYVGQDMHKGARIAAVGHGGQVLLSKETRGLVAVDATDLGEHRLKDFEEAVSNFKALLESRLAFWLRRGLGPDIRACACNGIRSRSGLSLARRSLTQSDALARRGRCRLSAKARQLRARL